MLSPQKIKKLRKLSVDRIKQFEVQIQFELANRYLIVFPFATMSHCIAWASLCKPG